MEPIYLNQQLSGNTIFLKIKLEIRSWFEFSYFKYRLYYKAILYSDHYLHFRTPNEDIWLSLNDRDAEAKSDKTKFKWHDGTYWDRVGFN